MAMKSSYTTRWDTIFFDHGNGFQWSAGTRRKCQQSYGYYLSFLRSCSRLDRSTTAVERFQSDDIAAFITSSCNRVSIRSVFIRVADLQRIAHAFDPRHDWTKLDRLIAKIRHQAGALPLKPGLGIDSATISTWAHKEMCAALTMPIRPNGWQRPIRYRDALMVALLIARPLRLRAFIHIAINQHLIRTCEGFELAFAASDMKDRRTRHFALPDTLVEPMEIYLSSIRQELIKGEVTDHLWVSRKGGPLSYDGFQTHLHDITSRAFGIGMRPHAFRHIAATSIAEQDPVNVATIASLLGHTTLAISERHYNRASMLTAARRYQSVIKDARNKSRRRRADE